MVFRIIATVLMLATLAPAGKTPSADKTDMSVPAGAERVEQISPGTHKQARLVDSFEGLGEDFAGPQGKAMLRNPSDNSIAVGPDNVVVTVNSRMAIFTKKGRKFDTTGKILYGPVNTNN